jgi:hypothetical protein
MIRHHVRSQVYKAVFRQLPNSACGLVLGDVTEKRIEHALPVIGGFAPSEYRSLPQCLDEARPVADKVAQYCGEDVVGIFTAYDDFPYSHTNEMRGFLVDYLLARNLVFLCQFPTLGGETIWGISVYWAGAFPHEGLEYKMTPRKSVSQQHNPRRVLKMWKNLKDELSNKSIPPTS